MPNVSCPSCGAPVAVPEKKSGLPWAIGCIVALVVVPVVVGIIGMLAAIAIPSFVKARSTSQSNACVNNMRMIDAAKEQWALAEARENGDEVDLAGVNQYIKSAMTPVCPAGGEYTYGLIGEDPQCSVHGSLSMPRSRPPPSADR